MGTKRDDEQGRRLLTAVERIVAKSAAIRANVDGIEAMVKSTQPDLKGDELRSSIAYELVKHYSNRAAIAGGASALPGLIPGWGTLAAFGGALAELPLLLKWEVEMALALSHLYGFDIEDPSERQLSFLMASVGTYDARGKNFFADVLRLEGTAIWNYAPRQVARLVAQAFALVAAMYLWRGFLKAVPVVGIVAGSSLNKVLTERVGARCMRDLKTRRELMREKPARAAAPKKAKGKKKAAKAKRVVRREPPAPTLN